MVLNYEWNGIMKHKYDVSLSLKEYGFAIKFVSKTKDEHFYECLIPDEEDSYYLCTLSVEEVRDIIDEHPEIPVKEDEVDKKEIGDLLYLLDLYCDINEVLDLECAEKVDYYDISIDTSLPEDFIESEAKPKRKRGKTLTMTKEKATQALETISRYRLYNFSSYYNTVGMKYLTKIERTKIAYCKRLLWLCGESVKSFMEKIKNEAGKLYWYKDGEYIELK